MSAVLGVLHTRLLADDPGQLLNLSGELTCLIVLAYKGPAVAKKELRRPIAKAARSPQTRASESAHLPRDPFAGLSMRLTYRTLRVLAAVGEKPAARNRAVGDASGVSDQGQISKLLMRLEGLGLIENTTIRQDRGGAHHRDQATGEPNAWCLTLRGEEVEQATRVSDGV